jgi:protoheme IX farnesyltransferase
MATADPPVLPAARTRPVVRRRSHAEPSRFADFAELTKPKIAAMALVTVAAGYALGADPHAFRPDLLVHTLIGAALVAAGGSALNHWLERRADAKMWRTANRPLPAGRVLPGEALGFGVVLAVGGTAWLSAALPSPAGAVAAAATFALYVFVYTPLKRVTHWNTVVGAIPGALPPVIGWAAARGDVSAEGWALFAILFVWQLPHFYSIAYLHRDDYARGGMVMLPVIDGRDARRTGLATALTCGLLLVVTAAPYMVGSVSWAYLVGAMPLGAWFLARSVRFALCRDNQTARSVLRGSLGYLLGVMALLVADGVLPRYLG